MDKKIQDMIKNLEFRAPVSDDVIDNFEKSSELNLPSDYKMFLKITNGGEGFIGDNSYVMFWPLKDLNELNDSYEVDEFAPGLLLFGSNGGGEAFAFDTRSKSMNIVQVPFVGMELNLIQELTTTFNKFIEKLYYAKEDE